MSALAVGGSPGRKGLSAVSCDGRLEESSRIVSPAWRLNPA